jgi:signal transduction histidine kinase
MPRRRRISTVTLRAWGGFLIFVALVAGAALTIGRQLDKAAAARAAVEATAGRIDRLDLLVHELLDAEVGQRGFIIAGDELFLEPYDASILKLDDTLRAVEADMGSSPRGRADAARLRGLVAAKLGFMDRTIELRRTAGLGAAAREVASREGKRLMDAIRAEVARRVGAERGELATLDRSVKAAERGAQRLIYAALVGAVGLVLAIGLMLLGQLRARLRAEREQRRAAGLLRVSLDNIGAGVAVTDEAGRILLRNAELVRMLPDAGQGDAPASMADELALARAGKPALFEREIDGATVVVRGTKLPQGRYILSYLDITAARRAERVKSEFVSTVSHELRTPVTSIRGSLGMLAGPLSAGLSDKQKPLVDIALRNADRLTLLVNDILDIEKIESGSLAFDFQACDLNQLLREAAETNRAYAEAREVMLALGTLPRPLLVWADPNRIQQVMSNLVSNAVKFSDPNGIVTITAEQSGDTARVSVHDRGPGVPEAFKARIFERFAQADASDARAKGGTGLGLAIAQAIVLKHGGKLQFESAPGSTTFTFSMPLCSTDGGAG